MAQAFKGHFAIGKEVTYGTPVTPTDFARYLEAEVEVNQNVHLPENSGSRYQDTAVFGPLDPRPRCVIEVRPDTIGRFLQAAVGRATTVGTDVGGGGGSQLNGAVSAGATVVTLDSVAGYAVNDYVQIGVSSPDLPEVRKVTAVGAFTLTLDKALTFAHADNEVCNEVAAPFTHTFTPTDDLDSYTAEKRIGTFGTKAFRVPGSKVNTAEVRFEATSGAAGAAQGEFNWLGRDVDDTGPNAATLSALSAFMFHHGSVELGGVPLPRQPRNVRVGWNNQLVEDDYVIGSRRRKKADAGGLVVEGEYSLVFDDLEQIRRFWGSDAATTPAAAPTFRALSVILDDGTRHLKFVMPSVLLTAGTVSAAGKSQVTQRFTFGATEGSGGAVPMTAELKNAVPYYD